MDFKIIKKDLRKPILWFASLTLSFMVISSIIILSMSGLELRKKISLFCQFNLNFLLVYMVCLLTNLSKISISLFYNIEVITNTETDDKEIRILKSRFVSIFITIFSIGAFFIEMTSGSVINQVSWVQNASETWWIYLIIFIINVIYLYLFFEINKYLISQNEEFRNQYLEFIKNPPKKEVIEKN
ncbi:hypothetical protein [Spiroplasma cantharicola]|uniref:Transmembrane protein n=1 Tax=Spiroplasma cantharicola TaxID=362837 RepID=A0A0M3SJ23_9MOLU|nr:hypothetical protein [Spiroplasma cantharicola]ALD65994.1 hypothetical protein SCANT_v1c00840 [Spiroplasma cantharicola]